MSEHCATLYIKPAYLDWTIEGIKVILNRYGANLHEMVIKKASRSNPFGKKAHPVSLLIDIEPKMMPYMEKRLLKEPGVLR